MTESCGPVELWSGGRITTSLVQWPICTQQLHSLSAHATVFTYSKKLRVLLLPRSSMHDQDTALVAGMIGRCLRPYHVFYNRKPMVWPQKQWQSWGTRLRSKSGETLPLNKRVSSLFSFPYFLDLGSAACFLLIFPLMHKKMCMSVLCVYVSTSVCGL